MPRFLIAVFADSPIYKSIAIELFLTKAKDALQITISAFYYPDNYSRNEAILSYLIQYVCNKV